MHHSHPFVIFFSGSTNIESPRARRGGTRPEPISGYVFRVPLPKRRFHLVGRHVETEAEKSGHDPDAGRRQGAGKLHNGLHC